MRKPESELKGELAKLSYISPNGSFAVGSLTDKTIVVGSIGHASPGQILTLKGSWVDHQTFGKQFKATHCTIQTPQTTEGLLRYLAKGGFKGIGPAMAKRIVEHFGMRTLSILSDSPEELLKISGIGPKTLSSISRTWQSDQKRHKARVVMSGLGIGLRLIESLEAHYGDDALSIIKKDPYRISREVQGVGFLTADRIAMTQGLSKDDPGRAEAALLHAMREIENDGHCYATYADIFEHAERLSVPIGCIDRAIHRLKGSELAKTDPNSSRIHRASTLRAEKRVASALLSIHGRKKGIGLFSSESIDIAAIQGKMGMLLNDEQIQAIKSALNAGLTVITGGPGTGKTTIVKAALAAAQLRGESWSLAAPTGRAAKRMSEATGAPATTLHRLLGYSGHNKGFSRHEANRLEADVILIDEASMLDLWLIDALLKAIPKHARLILIGDADQLPSVGPGQILSDLILSRKAEINALNTVYRQALDANIVLNAHRIRAGTEPISSEKDPRSSEKKDFFVIRRNDSEACIETLVAIVTKRLTRLGLSPLEDLQVLSPMRGGPLGIERLNESLQEALNPTPSYGKDRMKVGDRIMQIRNDHENAFYNGDIGRIVSITDDGIEVDIDGRRLFRKGAQLSELELAYATTIHKSQGSEYPAVILMLGKSQSIMLKRNLIYTAVTRAKRFCCIIEHGDALKFALNKEDSRKRQTLLHSLLSGKIEIG